MIKIGAAARRSVFALAVSAGLLAALIAAASFVAPMLVPAAELRRLTFAAISDATGQEAGSGGDAHIAFFPSPHLVVRKVVFPMPGGAALDAESATVSLRLMPLLVGQLEAAGVVLDKATLVVTGSAALSHFAFATLVSSRDLPELRLSRGTIAVRNRDGLTEELVSGIEARLDRSSSGRALTYDAAFTWREVKSEVRISLADVTAFLAGRPTETALDASTGTGSGASWLRFRGTSSYGLKPQASGSITAETGSVRKLVEWTGVAVPLNGGLGAFSVSATVSADRGGAALNPVSAVLDGNRSEGALHLTFAGGHPALEGTFASDQIDITPYGRLTLTENAAGEWDHRPLDLAALSALDFDLRLSAGKVRTEDREFEQVATSAVLRGGKLVLALGTAKAWGGNVRASLALGPAADGSGAMMRLQGDATRVALGKALDDLAGVRRLDGIGDIAVQLEGRGRSFYNMAETLGGSVAISGANGALLGIDVGQLLRRIERRPLSGSGDLRGGRTPFDTLTAKFSLKAGIASLDKAQLESKQVRLDLAGDVSVPDREIALKGIAALLATSDRDTAFELPFLIQGPWNSPYVRLDPQSLIRHSGAAQPLLDAVRNKGGAGEAAVRSVLDQLAKPTALPPAPAKLPGN